MKKILGLALAGAFLIACGSQNKQSTGMQNTTAANQEPAPAPMETTPPANSPATEMNTAPAPTNPPPAPTESNPTTPAPTTPQ